MKLKFLFGVALGGGVDALRDDVHEVPAHQAKRLIQRGKAIPAEEDEPSSEKKAKK
jgi:hypothetical protein